MQTSRLVQAVVLMLIVAMAASCTATKEYASKIFPSQNVEKDSQAVALRFLDLDKLEPDQENWVSTDIIMGRDTASNTAALDKLSEVYPSSQLNTAKKDSAATEDTKSATPIYANSAPVSDKNIVLKSVKKNSNVNRTYAASNTKDTLSKIEKVEPVANNIKTEEVEQPVARNYNSGEVREKKSRDDK
jgi:hypothetical protein